MSKELSKFQFSLDQCEQELAEFGALLDSQDELSEKNDLLPSLGHDLILPLLLHPGTFVSKR